MMQPVFVLGRPGSGKSTVCCYLADTVPSYRIRGFPILQEMFEQEQYRCYFEPSNDYGGFLVKHDVVYDLVLDRMVLRAFSLYFSQDTGLLLIELARGDYQESLWHFKPLLCDAYALCLDMPLTLCQKRIAARVASDEEDRHEPPSEFIFRHCVEQHLPGPDAFPAGRLISLDNTGCREHLYAQLDQFIERLHHEGSATFHATESTRHPEGTVLQEQTPTRTTY